MRRMQGVLSVALPCALAAALLLGGLALPDGTWSQTERRQLAQKPELTAEAVLSGDYAQDWASYLADQFPLRRGLRTAMGLLRTRVLGQRDNRGYYDQDGWLCKLETELRPDQVRWAARKMGDLETRYFQGSALGWAVIPDKGQLAGGGHPALDLAAMEALIAETAPSSAQQISLAELLTLEDYYRTDTHWRQERLEPVADRILDHFGASAPRRQYTAHSLSLFTGGYYGQAGLPAEPEDLVYLTDPVTEAALVTSAEAAETLPVYTLEKFDGMDGYDVFLNGAQAVVTVENPLAETDRELILFRDSFGSSLAPLLLGGYARVTLVDLRYVSSEILGDYVDFHPGQDVLFLYSAPLWNSGALLK